MKIKQYGSLSLVFNDFIGKATVKWDFVCLIAGIFVLDCEIGKFEKFIQVEFNG